MRRRWSCAALVLPVLLVLRTTAGCHGCGTDATPAEPAPEDAGAEAAEPRPGGTLVVAFPGDVETFNPLVARIQTTRELQARMFPYLVVPEFDCRLTFTPGLASAWRFSDDGRDITFTLRDDMTWQDGEPIDADDVLFTWELVADPAVGSPLLPNLDALDDERPYEKTDAHTIVVHFEQAADPILMLAQLASIWIVPRHVLADVPREGMRGAPFASAPVASGPLVLERWDRGHEVVLQRRDDFTGGDPMLLDRVVVRVIPDHDAQLTAFRAGEVDMVLGVEIEDLARLRADRPDAQVMRRGWRFLEYIGWNLRDERLADERVRRALAHAIDTDTLMAVLLSDGTETYARRATGTTTPEICDVVDETLEPLAFDPDRARGLLAEAGWTDTDGDGVLDRGGEPLTIELLYSTGHKRREQASVLIQDQLSKIGVKLELRPLERNALYEKLGNHDFQAVLAGWSAGLFVDPTDFWHSQSSSPFNYTGFVDPRVDRLIDQGLAAPTPEEAAPLWKEMQRVIYEAQPYCFLYWVDEVVLLDGRFRDASVTTLSFFQDLEHWWVPEDRRRY